MVDPPAATPTRLGDGDGEHPVARALRRAASGTFPAVDGVVETVAPWRPGLAAIVSFTGHALVAVDRPLPDHARRLLDAFGGAHHPQVAVAIAGVDGWIDSLDVVLAAHGVGGPSTLTARPDLADHPRAVHASTIRDSVRCYGPPDAPAFVTLGAGLGGLPELGIEIDPPEGRSAGRSAGSGASTTAGAGRELVTAALSLIPRGDPVIAAVAPGNARALRCFLAAGFTPIGGVQLILPAG